MGEWELSEPERRRNARELERLMAELDEVDRRHGLGAHPATLGSPGESRTRRERPARGRSGRGRSSRTSRRRTRGERSRTALITFVVAVTMFGFVVVDTVDVGLTVARVQAWLTGEPAPPREGRGYSFAQTQPSSDEPVGWSPCEPIRVLVNSDGAPAGGVRMVEEALQKTNEASGLDLQLVGSSDSRDFFDAGRDLEEPVLVGWAGPQEVPALSGRIAGLGGAVSEGVQGARQYLVSGTVVLDSPLFRTLSRSSGGMREAQAIVDHEIGHLVGLSHVRDSTQLMNAESGATDYGAGDLAGLAALGEVPCRVPGF
ncbi:hypothetical protein KLP28_15410 [Nocardioidaceae bacterium]|nr:hypothetical protein KLP28_15410 [Nocardioidaceae bacterium]